MKYCLPALSFNVMWASLGVLASGLLFIIPNRNFEEAVQMFRCLDAGGNDCLKSNYGTWYMIWLIYTIAVAIAMVVFLVLTVTSASCCNCRFDDALFSLFLGATLVAAIDFFPYIFSTLAYSKNLTSGNLDGQANLMSIAVNCRWNNLSMIIVFALYFIVSATVKTWTCCSKTGAAIGGTILAFGLGCIWVPSKIDGYCKTFTCPVGTLVTHAVLSAAAFILVFIFCSFTSCLEKCCTCKCCKCRCCR